MMKYLYFYVHKNKDKYTNEFNKELNKVQELFSLVIKK